MTNDEHENVEKVSPLKGKPASPALKQAIADHLARKSAEYRAEVMAYMDKHPSDRNNTPGRIAAKLGWGAGKAGKVLKEAAQMGLLQLNGGGKRIWYTKPGAKSSRAVTTVTKKPPARAKHGPLGNTSSVEGIELLHARHAPKAIELVVDGVQIVLGRNPRTGRLRIMLED